jgi:hypothetical protein
MSIAVWELKYLLQERRPKGVSGPVQSDTTLLKRRPTHLVAGYLRVLTSGHYYVVLPLRQITCPWT